MGLTSGEALKLDVGSAIYSPQTPICKSPEIVPAPISSHFQRLPDGRAGVGTLHIYALFCSKDVHLA